MTMFGPPLPGTVKVVVDGWRCSRCTHEWVARNKDALPKVCPKCKSPYWNSPRKFPKGHGRSEGNPK